MRAVAIAVLKVKLLFRDRSNIFFVFIFPIALILLIGAQFGGDVEPVVGLHMADDSELATQIAAALRETTEIEIRDFASVDALAKVVERGNVQAGVFLPAGLDEVVAAGETAEIGFVARPDGLGTQLQSVIGARIAEVMKPVGAARFAAAETGSDPDEAIEIARSIAGRSPGIDVNSTAVGEALFPSSLGRFDLGASQQLVLFVFLTALAGSSGLILSRQLGITRRMLSSPTSLGTIVVGESFGRWAVAMVQGIYIMVLTLGLFGVDWGDPVGAALILVAFSATGAGAGILLGSSFDNDQQAQGISIILSLGLAALGGAMLPAELFSPTMQKVAHATPHAWALDGFAELVRHGGNTLDILPELGVLALYASVLLILAAWRLRAAVTRP